MTNPNNSSIITLTHTWLLFTPMVSTVTNPVYLKLPYGKRPDSGPITVLACSRAAQCTTQE